jgi:hypothetical protein
MDKNIKYCCVMLYIMIGMVCIDIKKSWCHSLLKHVTNKYKNCDVYKQNHVTDMHMHNKSWRRDLVHRPMQLDIKIEMYMVKFTWLMCWEIKNSRCLWQKSCNWCVKTKNYDVAHDLDHVDCFLKLIYLTKRDS